MVQVHLDEVLPPVAVPPPPARALGAIAHALSQQDRERTTASSSNGMCGCVGCVRLCVYGWLCVCVRATHLLGAFACWSCCDLLQMRPRLGAPAMRRVLTAC